MTTLLLTLSLSLVAQPGDPHPLRDLEFIRATEESVAAMAPGSVPPEPYRSLIDEGLSADCYRCREMASKKLRAASVDDPRWLFWGRRHRDPEVRLRCNAIIRRTNPCRACSGTGLGVAESMWIGGDVVAFRLRCDACGGVGSVWGYGPWD